MSKPINQQNSCPYCKNRFTKTPNKICVLTSCDCLFHKECLYKNVTDDPFKCKRCGSETSVTTFKCMDTYQTILDKLGVNVEVEKKTSQRILGKVKGLFRKSDESMDVESHSSLESTQQNISAMEVEPLSSFETLQQNKTCPVCKQLLKENQNTTIASCGCKFHTNHWEAWNVLNPNNCPRHGNLADFLIPKSSSTHSRRPICALCNQSIETNKEQAHLYCGHNFHVDHLIEFIKSNGQICPICKTKTEFCQLCNKTIKNTQNRLTLNCGLSVHITEAMPYRQSDQKLDCVYCQEKHNLRFAKINIVTPINPLYESYHGKAILIDGAPIYCFVCGKPLRDKENMMLLDCGNLIHWDKCTPTFCEQRNPICGVCASGPTLKCTVCDQIMNYPGETNGLHNGFTNCISQCGFHLEHIQEKLYTEFKSIGGLKAECPNCKTLVTKITIADQAWHLPGKGLTNLLDLWELNKEGQRIELKCGHAFCLDRNVNMLTPDSDCPVCVHRHQRGGGFGTLPVFPTFPHEPETLTDTFCKVCGEMFWKTPQMESITQPCCGSKVHESCYAKEFPFFEECQICTPLERGFNIMRGSKTSKTVKFEAEPTVHEIESREKAYDCSLCNTKMPVVIKKKCGHAKITEEGDMCSDCQQKSGEECEHCRGNWQKYICSDKTEMDRVADYADEHSWHEYLNNKEKCEVYKENLKELYGVNQTYKCDKCEVDFRIEDLDIATYIGQGSTVHENAEICKQNLEPKVTASMAMMAIRKKPQKTGYQHPLFLTGAICFVCKIDIYESQKDDVLKRALRFTCCSQAFYHWDCLQRWNCQHNTRPDCYICKRCKSPLDGEIIGFCQREENKARKDMRAYWEDYVQPSESEMSYRDEFLKRMPKHILDKITPSDGLLLKFPIRTLICCMFCFDELLPGVKLQKMDCCGKYYHDKHLEKMNFPVCPYCNEEERRSDDPWNLLIEENQ